MTTSGMQAMMKYIDENGYISSKKDTFVNDQSNFGPKENKYYGNTKSIPAILPTQNDIMCPQSDNSFSRFMLANTSGVTRIK
jgi:hypothetical protein